jgi:polar amino acid transport system substrate-binding protein
MTNASAVSAAIFSAFTPTGKLRASINLGNPLLANADAAGRPFGISVDLAHALAQRLGAELELLTFGSAGASVATVAEQRADVGFFAIEPKRGAEIAFTAPYVLIEGFYLVRENSPITTNEAVDVAGNRVVVGAASAYDLYLTRTLQHATIVRTNSSQSQSVVGEFLALNAEVAAGVKQPLEAEAKRVGGVRLLNERFMTIRQAMGLPKSRGKEAEEFLHGFVEEMKSSGFVRDSLERHAIVGAAVAAGEAFDR